MKGKDGKHKTGTALPTADVESSSSDGALGEKEAPKPHQKCRIHVHSRTNYLADPDGRSVKAVIDGLVEAGILQDDSAEFVSEISQTQEVTKGEEETIIEIIWETPAR